MEMCYDGALVMPKNYAVMSEEEMVYMEGGAFTCAEVENAVNIGVSAVLLAIGVGYGIGSIVWFIKNSVNGLVVSGLELAIKSALGALGFTTTSGIYGLLATINPDWSIGHGVAWLIDNKFETGAKRGNGLCFG